LEARGLLYTISWAYALLAEVTLMLNDVKSGVELAEASRGSLRAGDRLAEPITYCALAIGGALNKTLEWSDVLSHLQKAVSIAIAAGTLPRAAVSQFRYAECLHKKGDPPAALEQLSEAERLFATMKMTWWSEQAAGLRARVEGNQPFVWFAPYVDGPPELAR